MMSVRLSRDEYMVGLGSGTVVHGRMRCSVQFSSVVVHVIHGERLVVGNIPGSCWCRMCDYDVVHSKR